MGHWMLKLLIVSRRTIACPYFLLCFAHVDYDGIVLNILSVLIKKEMIWYALLAEDRAWSVGSWLGVVETIQATSNSSLSSWCVIIFR